MEIHKFLYLALRLFIQGMVMVMVFFACWLISRTTMSEVSFLALLDIRVAIEKLLSLLPRVGTVIGGFFTGFSLPYQYEVEQISLFQEAFSGLLLFASTLIFMKIYLFADKVANNVVPATTFGKIIANYCCMVPMYLGTVSFTVIMDTLLLGKLGKIPAVVQFIILLVCVILLSFSNAGFKFDMATIINGTKTLLIDILIVSLLYLAVLSGRCLMYDEYLTSGEMAIVLIIFFVSVLSLTVLVSLNFSKSD